MVDTGAQISIIKSNVVPQNSEIIKEKLFISGMGGGSLNSLGKVVLLFGNREIILHVIDHKTEFVGDGILGSDFFNESGAIICYQKKLIEIGGLIIPFLSEKERDLEFSRRFGNKINIKGNFKDFLKFLEEQNEAEVNLEKLEHLYTIEYEDMVKENVEGTDFIDDHSNNSRAEKILELINFENLENSKKGIVRGLIYEYNDCIYLKGDPWKGTTIVTHRIITTSNNPVVVKPYKWPYHLRGEVNKQVQNWLDLGIIRESNSNYNSPLWIVEKKPDSKGNPQWRCVIDFQKLNKITLMDEFPLPTLLSIFDRLCGAKFFTVLDLASGFLQIPVHEDDIPKTAFSTEMGHFEFTKMPFGLKTAPKTFQKCMNICLKGLMGFGVFCYLDDVVIYAHTIEEHDRIFREVMKRFRECNLKIQIDKCRFLERTVQYLGHEIGEHGVKPDKTKVSAVENFPVPKSRKNIRQFMGLSGFYRRFIKGYAAIGKPLFQLLRDDVTFRWGEKQQEAFEKLKKALCTAPILVYPDFKKKNFIIFTDASGYAVGAILAQGTALKHNVIAYYSRVLKDNELKYSTFEREALAISEAIKQFKQYVYGSHFIIYTDHKPLTTQKECLNNERCQKWKLALQGYDYEIKYFPGKSNTGADALSRCVNFFFNIYMICMIYTNILTTRYETIVVNALTRLQARMNDQFDDKTENKQDQSKRKISIGKKKKGKEKRNDNNNIIPGVKLQSKIKVDQNADSIEKNKKCKFIIVQDSLDLRHDNILYFMNSNGNCLDEGSQRLENRNLLPKRKRSQGLFSLLRSKKYYFEICLNVDCAHEIIRKNLKKYVLELREIVYDKKLTSLSMSKGNVGQLKWDTIQKIFEEVFINDDLKIFLCKNKLKFVELDKRNVIFDEFHNSLIGGHAGIKKTLKRIKDNYYWENMRADITNRIKHCLKCQLKKFRRDNAKNPMLITDTPTEPIIKCAMDICGPFEKTKNGNVFVMTMQCCFSKYMVMVPIPDQTAQTVAKYLIKRFICIYGCPEIILTDLGKNFVSKLLKEVAKQFSIKRVFTTPYRPSSNGALERAHTKLNEFLRHYTNKEREWDELIEFASFCYNTSVHESTNFSPYELLFGKKARFPSESLTLKEKTYFEYVSDMISRLSEIQEFAYKHLIDAKERNKRYYDRKLRPNELKIGDFVFLQINSNRKKMDDIYRGPFEVLDILNNHNVKIRYKRGYKVVHSDKLRLSHIEK